MEKYYFKLGDTIKIIQGPNKGLRGVIYGIHNRKFIVLINITGQMKQMNRYHIIKDNPYLRSIMKFDLKL